MRAGEEGQGLTPFRWAFPLTLPVMAGYLFLGITYGILMVTKGFPAWLPVVTALVIYTGSMEFLLSDILLSSFHPLTAFATAFAVGARHLFYGLAMLKKYRGMGWRKFYLIYTTSDETFALNYTAEVPEGLDRGASYFWVSLLDQVYWVAGSAAGAFLGGLFTINTEGLDFVMTAMFTVIFVDQWMKDRNHASEIIGVCASVICLFLFGAENFLLPAMGLILLMLAVFRKRIEAGAKTGGSHD